VLFERHNRRGERVVVGKCGEAVRGGGRGHGWFSSSEAARQLLEPSSQHAIAMT
jgi:hypothetical protein